MSHQLNTRGKPHTCRYPWGEWLEPPRRGTVRMLVLKRGTHYFCQPHGMRSSVIQASRRAPHKGLIKVRVKMDEGVITVEVRNA
jgi:hypothetical protein